MNRFHTMLGVLVLFFNLTLPSYAQTTTNVNFDCYRAGSQYLAYPVPADGIPALTTAPVGYAPFHMEHYGRHGSRWLLDDDAYSQPLEFLKKAKEEDKLTQRGLLLVEQLQFIKEDAQNRRGELSPLGHEQHRGIARRMVENFPELFADGTHVDAKSTVVIRCILSMANEISEIQRIKPNISVSCDATRRYQRILAPNSTDTVARRIEEEAHERLTKPFQQQHSDHKQFMCKVFNDTAWAAGNPENKELFKQVFDIAVNTQSHNNHPDIYDLFTEEELFEQWQNNNVWWYINSGNTSLTNNRIPYKQRVLLKNIIESADTAMVSPRQSVNLRFGHESIVLPLAVLMELNDCGYDTDDLTTLSDHWRNYEVFMMASNIQMVFYRPINNAEVKLVNNTEVSLDNILVKMMLNEAEVRLPLEPVSGPYYRWIDVRNYYVNKLEQFSMKYLE